MKISEVGKLAEIMREYSLSRLEIQDGEHHLLIERGTAAATSGISSDIKAITADTAAASDSLNERTANTFTYNSPMVGVFYSSPSPDSAPFVETGKAVARGDVLGIIEAMKLMNEIAAEEAGEVVDILVGNGDVVEFGQPLFVLRRTGTL